MRALPRANRRADIEEEHNRPAVEAFVGHSCHIRSVPDGGRPLGMWPEMASAEGPQKTGRIPVDKSPLTSDGQALKPSLLNPRGLPLVSSHRSGKVLVLYRKRSGARPSCVPRNSPRRIVSDTALRLSRTYFRDRRCQVRWAEGLFLDSNRKNYSTRSRRRTAASQ